MIYLIAYDITDDSLRNKVQKYLSGWGRRVQKSVFECDLNSDELKQVASHLKNIIKQETDRCHIYRLCAECISFRDVIGNDLEPAWGNTVVI
jgi:CRISPR-associated protein Cas2